MEEGNECIYLFQLKSEDKRNSFNLFLLLHSADNMEACGTLGKYSLTSGRKR